MLLQRSLDLFREIAFLDGMAHALHALGLLALAQGHCRRAGSLQRESLKLLRDSGYNGGIMTLLEGLAAVARAQHSPGRAARLFGAAEQLRESYSSPLRPNMRSQHERDVAAARAQVDEVTWEAAWAEGRAMALEQAIAYALEPIDPNVA